MQHSSKVLENAIREIAKLPGIGQRTALRLALHMLRQEKEDIHQFTEAVNHLVDDVIYCSKCHNISDTEICQICADPKRDASLLCIVEDIRDVLAIEQTSQYRGLYHVLGGLISPMEGIGPTDLNISDLVGRIQGDEVKEVIFALSSNMEGDTTTFYIYKKLEGLEMNVSTIARGLAVGDALEYADEITLGRSLQQRVPYEQSLKS
ncbi:MAG: recombination protein RecR [Flavobacteriia bacterium]|nr:recombination protein RecR [Flavobacteriia bacterium]